MRRASRIKASDNATIAVSKAIKGRLRIGDDWFAYVNLAVSADFSKKIDQVLGC